MRVQDVQRVGARAECEAVKNKSYSELLKDPRWQRRRLEIMQRDMFECTVCEDKTSTLHVHHKVYRKGLKPWEAPDGDLVTVCESCHELYEEQKSRLTELVAKMTFHDLDLVIGYASAFHAYCVGEEKIQINGPDDGAGVARFFGLDFSEVMKLCGPDGVDPDVLMQLRSERDRTQ